MLALSCRIGGSELLIEPPVFSAEVVLRIVRQQRPRSMPRVLAGWECIRDLSFCVVAGPSSIVELSYAWTKRHARALRAFDIMALVPCS
jgi:hypothetical protein